MGYRAPRAISPHSRDAADTERLSPWPRGDPQPPSGAGVVQPPLSRTAPGVEVATDLGVRFADVDGHEIFGAYGGQICRDDVSDRRDPVERRAVGRYAPDTGERLAVAHCAIADDERSSLDRQLLRPHAVDACRGPVVREPSGEDLSPPGVEYSQYIPRARERGGGEGVQGGVLREGDACARGEGAG